MSLPLETRPRTIAQFGASNGPGFGWRDINVYKIGAEWRYDPRWTLRAGYSYNDNPISSRDVMMNILAPGVIQNHITGGFKYRWSDNLDLEFSAMYAPERTAEGKCSRRSRWAADRNQHAASSRPWRASSTIGTAARSLSLSNRPARNRGRPIYRRKKQPTGCFFWRFRDDGRGSKNANNHQKAFPLFTRR